jgi:hypothetical protein
MYLPKAIREATLHGELHPLVRDGYASPNGMCNALLNEDDGCVRFCCCEYGHDGQHVNGTRSWSMIWPPQ